MYCWAFATIWLVRHLKLEDLISKAFIAGLLHDMGKLCLLSALEKMLISQEDSIKLTDDLIKKILVNFHEKQGYDLLVSNKLERNDPKEDLTYVMGSKEIDILGIKETSIALLEIAMEDRGLISPASPGAATSS